MRIIQESMMLKVIIFLSIVIIPTIFPAVPCRLIPLLLPLARNRRVERKTLILLLHHLILLHHQMVIYNNSMSVWTAARARDSFCSRACATASWAAWNPSPVPGELSFFVRLVELAPRANSTKNRKELSMDKPSTAIIYHLPFQLSVQHLLNLRFKQPLDRGELRGQLVRTYSS